MATVCTKQPQAAQDGSAPGSHLPTSAHAADLDWQQVDEALGRKPAVSGDVRRYGFPRTDLTVTLDGNKVEIVDAKGGKSIVTIADVNQSNGVIHVVDSVLLPKS